MLRKLLTLSCILAATCAMAQKKSDKPVDGDYTKIGAPMPRLNFQLYKDTVKENNSEYHYLTNKDVDNDANLLIMMFNPTCSHCEDETDRLEKNIFLFKKTNLLLMATPVMRPQLRDFVNRLHLDEYPSIHVGSDSSDFIGKVYLYSSLPQINIYDHDRKLLRTFNGEVAIDTLKKYIE